jgi:myb proto-oncogene protein
MHRALEVSAHPSTDHSAFTPQEVELMAQLHASVGTKYAEIARCLPGRTTREVKNHVKRHC